MPSDFVALQEPFGEDAIRTVNFFNGRLLTGGDLGREQAARREADARLALAVGDGVAFGLEVTDGGLSPDGGLPTVRVAAGLAINRLGQTLRLTQAVQVALARGSAAATSNDGLFGDCAPVLGGTYVAGAGVYILTLAAAEARAGSAPTRITGVSMRASSTQSSRLSASVPHRRAIHSGRSSVTHSRSANFRKAG